MEKLDNKKHQHKLSPCQRHIMHHQAKSAAGNSEDGQPEGTQYELQLIQLNQHRRQLKGIESRQRKQELKANIVPDYLPYVYGVIGSGKAVQDEIVMTMLIWSIDAGLIDEALKIAAYCLEHSLQPSEQYNRKLPCLIAEEIADRDGVEFEQLRAVHVLTSDMDMPDQVRAKLHKGMGLALAENDPVEALAHLERAIELHDSCGVKKQSEGLRRTIKKAKEAEEKPTSEPTVPEKTENKEDKTSLADSNQQPPVEGG